MENTAVTEIVQLKISEDRMQAVLLPVHPSDHHPDYQEMIDFLHSKNVVHGINEDAIHDLLEKFENWTEPVVVAEGSRPVPGKPGYLKEHTFSTKRREPEAGQMYIDLRTRTEILSVKKGEKIAEIVPPTGGIPGKKIDGSEVPAKPGKELRLKKGKNTVIDNATSSVYAVADGQVSIQKRAVHVFPVYEVKGDLDLKTGNLDFVGNIHISGDVPSGYTIKAEGDIRINGLVEGSELKAGGSIYIRNGVAGQGRSYIRAENDLHTGYINQGNILVGGDLHVNSLNHSHVSVEGNIFCQQGNGLIIGGKTTAGSNIYVNRLGTDLMTKTEIFFGVSPEILEEMTKLTAEVKKDEESFTKLNQLKQAVEAKPVSEQTDKERILLLRVKNTHGQLAEGLKEKKERLVELNEYVSMINHSMLSVKDHVHPGVEITFGKYKRKIQAVHEAVEVKLNSGEIIIGHL